MFARQDAIIAKLEALKAKIDGMSSQSETSSSTNSALISSIPQGSGSKTAVKDLPKVSFHVRIYLIRVQLALVTRL